MRRSTPFGLVKVIDEEDDSLHKTRSGIGIGTPCYMAPEQALDAAHVDERADIFSVGAILTDQLARDAWYTTP